jgi:hypothetical protein
MLWAVLTQTEQLRQLLAQLGDQGLPLTFGVCPQDSHR